MHRNGDREHISREERDSLLYSKSIRKTAQPGCYLYTAKPLTFHSFADMKDYAATHSLRVGLVRRFIAGHFIWELNGKQWHELVETPEGMALRMAENEDCATA